MKKLLIISLLCLLALPMQAQRSIPKGYVDLGLPSGTLWKYSNEGVGDGFYTYNEAVRLFGNKLPTKSQWEELKDYCEWTWRETERGYKVTGSNGKFIVLPAAGYRYCRGDVDRVGSLGYYWSSTPDGSDNAWILDFYSSSVRMRNNSRCYGESVRLVQD